MSRRKFLWSQCKHVRADGTKCKSPANASGLCPRHAGVIVGDNGGGRTIHPAIDAKRLMARRWHG